MSLVSCDKLTELIVRNSFEIRKFEGTRKIICAICQTAFTGAHPNCNRIIDDIEVKVAWEVFQEATPSFCRIDVLSQLECIQIAPITQRTVVCGDLHDNTTASFIHLVSESPKQREGMFARGQPNVTGPLFLPQRPVAGGLLPDRSLVNILQSRKFITIGNNYQSLGKS